MLLKNGANPDLPDGNGQIPLFYAVVFQKYEMSELLLAYGANPDAKDMKGESPWSIVSERLADPLFAKEKEAYAKILKMMEKNKTNNAGK